MRIPHPTRLAPVARLARQVLDRVDRRLRQARPASVLILVIALLVLMALIGTAFISSAHIDRYSATQNTYTTQVDMLLQGAVFAAESPMLKKLQGVNGVYRMATGAMANVPGAYNTWEYPATDTYLADRLPTLIGSSPGWANITAPGAGLTFEAPYAVDSSGAALPNLPVRYMVRNNVIPTQIKVTQPDGVTVKIYPAFSITDPNVNGGKPATVLAADTDGDGIADAGFVRMPVGQIEGATYYYAVRIIDNCAAVNASIAMEPMMTAPPANSPIVPGDHFPTNLDLFHLLNASDATTGYANFNGYRFNNGATGNGENFTASPVDDTGAARSDFAFATPAESAWFQLGMRLNYPGWNTAAKRYQALPLSEGMAMVYHFCLANVNASPSAVLETYLPNSTYGATVNRPPYLPGDTVNWYNNNFAYDPAGKPNMPLRPILVARNPVSNFVPSWFPDRGAFANGTAYSFGDRVQAADPTVAGSPVRGFVCIRPNNGVAPSGDGTSPSTAYWAAMPWASHPTRINVNTATFGQLWAAYWSVMQEAPAAHQFRSPFRLGQPNPQGLTRGQVIQLRAAQAAVNTIDMRDGDEDVTSRTILLTPAAGDNGGTPVYANVYGSEKQPFITELLIEFDPNKPNPQLPYVVVELYNPYPTTIPLDGWKLVQFNRANNTLTEVGDLRQTLDNATPKHPRSIAAGERIVIQSDPGKIPTSLQAKWAARNPPFTPPASKTSGKTANTIANSVDGQSELVLMRPRLALAGATPIANYLTAPKALNPENAFDEGTAAPGGGDPQFNLADMVPVDQLDLLGLKPSADPNDMRPHRFRYARASAITADPGSAAWHCVFPGPYDLNKNAGGDGPFHLTGLVAVSPGGPSGAADDGNFGFPKSKFAGAPNTQSADKYSTNATYDTRPLQISNRDSAGPNRPYADQPDGTVLGGTPGNAPASFPFGGFTRNGDILQVPFIGGYKIYDATSGAILEMNSVTMDSVMARFEDPATNTPVNASYDTDNSLAQQTGNKNYLPFHNEQIGHFCPMDTAPDPNGNPTPAFDAIESNQAGWTYHWARRLFDYLAVYTPQDDYLPNIDPALSMDGQTSGDPTLVAANDNYNNAKYPNRTPTAVPNGPTVTTVQQANAGREDTAGTEGLVNLNTAHWKVLSTVPFWSPMRDGNFLQDNASLALAITTYRDQGGNQGGPFKSIFDLMNVPMFRQVSNAYVTASPSGPGEIDNATGDLSPFAYTMVKSNGSPETDPTDHVYGDVKSRFLLLQRVSNLVTTRSDSFTLYVQVQGWQNAGTAFPNLVVQRRLAVLADRSTVKPVRTGASGAPTLSPMGQTNVPNN